MALLIALLLHLLGPPVSQEAERIVCGDLRRGQDLPTKLDGGTANFHMAYLLLYKSTRGERAFTTGAMARSPRK